MRRLPIVNYHMVFDIKEDFCREVCLMVGGHMIHAPDVTTYSSMVTRMMIYIALTMAVSHDLEIKTADVLNANVTAPNREKTWTVLGPEFGCDAG